MQLYYVAFSGGESLILSVKLTWWQRIKFVHSRETVSKKKLLIKMGKFLKIHIRSRRVVRSKDQETDMSSETDI